MSGKKFSLILRGFLCALFLLMLSACRKPAPDVDIDLTALSSTMVYSEVFNMLYEPENYEGKTVRMEGVCARYHSNVSDSDYFSCIIEDATACCSQGIEFALAGEDHGPEDYPVDGKEIELQGVFEVYTEDNYQFCRIRDAILL